MVRYYVVSGDLSNGFDFEHIFRFYKDAEKKYHSIELKNNGAVFKYLYVHDDAEGDKTIMRESI